MGDYYQAHGDSVFYVWSGLLMQCPVYYRYIIWKVVILSKKLYVAQGTYSIKFDYATTNNMIMRLLSGGLGAHVMLGWVCLSATWQTYWVSCIAT